MWLTSLDLRKDFFSDKMSLINPTFVPLRLGKKTLAIHGIIIHICINTLESHVAVQVLFRAETREKFFRFCELFIGRLHLLGNLAIYYEFLKNSTSS